MNENRTNLLISQLKHANSLLQARLRALEVQLNHQQAIFDQRLRQLENQISDHETRLRRATEGVTQFKIFSGLASGGSGLMSLVAIIKAFLGA